MKCILIANGEYHNEPIIKEPNDLLIAVDGGYNYIQDKSLIDLIIGDLDSINVEDTNIPTIIYPTVKDFTDLDLAVTEAKSRGYHDFLIYGALGKRLEHSIANIQLLHKHQDLNIKLIDQDLVCFALHNETYHVDKCQFVSVFSLTNEAKVTIHGLKYDIENQILTNALPLGIDNEFEGTKQKDAYIKVISGTILVMLRYNK